MATLRARFTQALTLVTLFVSWLSIGATWRDALAFAQAGLAPVLGGTDTEFATGAAETVKLWARQLWAEATREIYWAKWMSTSENSIIQVKTDLEKGPGDKLTFSLRRKLTGPGLGGENATLEGQEEQLDIKSDSVTIDLRRHAVRLNGVMTERRVAFDLRTQAKDALAQWAAEYIDDGFFTQFDTSPTTVLFPGTATSTATITPADKFAPILLRRATAKAKKALPKIWPVRYMGRDWYVALIHTDVGFDWRNDPSWEQAQREVGLRGHENPIFTGALGIWDGVIVHEHEKTPIATNYGAGANLLGASNFFLGQKAGVFAWGQKTKLWEKTFDYELKTGVACGFILGFKKAVFNSADHAFMAIRTFRSTV